MWRRSTLTVALRRLSLHGHSSARLRHIMGQCGQALALPEPGNTVHIAHARRMHASNHASHSQARPRGASSGTRMLIRARQARAAQISLRHPPSASRGPVYAPRAPRSRRAPPPLFHTESAPCHTERRRICHPREWAWMVTVAAARASSSIWRRSTPVTR